MIWNMQKCQMTTCWESRTLRLYYRLQGRRNNGGMRGRGDFINTRTQIFSQRFLIWKLPFSSPYIHQAWTFNSWYHLFLGAVSDGFIDGDSHIWGGFDGRGICWHVLCILPGFGFMKFMIHSNAKVVPLWFFRTFPPLKYLLLTPSYHHVHHTKLNSNYCLFMPL